MNIAPQGDDDFRRKMRQTRMWGIPAMLICWATWMVSLLWPNLVSHWIGIPAALAWLGLVILLQRRMRQLRLLGIEHWVNNDRRE